MNYDWTQSFFFAIIKKPMEKSYWLFVEGTSFMLTADPPTEWRYVPPLYIDELAVLARGGAVLKHHLSCSPITTHWES